jgi:integrase
MLAKGIGRETVRRAMVLLQAMFTLGVEWVKPSAIQCPLCASPPRPHLRHRLSRALLADGDHFSATLVSVLAYAGVRPGEGIALERHHIRQDTILVEQAVSYGTLKLQKTGRIYRTVDLLPELREDILTWCDMKAITRPTRLCSPGPTATGCDPTTGRTGAAATSTRRPKPSASAAHAPTTSATPSLP